MRREVLISVLIVGVVGAVLYALWFKPQYERYLVDSQIYDHDLALFQQERATVENARRAAAEEAHHRPKVLERLAIATSSRADAQFIAHLRETARRHHLLVRGLTFHDETAPVAAPTAVASPEATPAAAAAAAIAANPTAGGSIIPDTLLADPLSAGFRTRSISLELIGRYGDVIAAVQDVPTARTLTRIEKLGFKESGDELRAAVDITLFVPKPSLETALRSDV